MLYNKSLQRTSLILLLHVSFISFLFSYIQALETQSVNFCTRTSGYLYQTTCPRGRSSHLFCNFKYCPGRQDPTRFSYTTTLYNYIFLLVYSHYINFVFTTHCHYINFVFTTHCHYINFVFTTHCHYMNFVFTTHCHYMNFVFTTHSHYVNFVFTAHCNNKLNCH